MGNLFDNKSNNHQNLDIYILICYCLEESNKELNYSDLTIGSTKECIKYIVNKKNILSSKNNSFLADDEVYSKKLILILNV